MIQSGFSETPYKKKSNKKKSKKSNHKHEYEDVIVLLNKFPHRGQQCKICGKTNVGFFFSRKENGFNFLLNYDEVKKKYPNLKVVKGFPK